MENAKFIIVQDAYTANQLITNGFNMVSNVNGICTFINAIPKHFNFENIDVKKLVYTNTLVF